MNRISFIVVGKNQEKTIYECLKSVYVTIKENNLKDYEVIFVDSDSKDRTVEIIKAHFPNVKLVYLKGRLNVGIAKNNGAARATGEVYFFIDGDITLDHKFISHVYEDEKGLKYDIVSGELEEILYNDNWEKIGYIENRFEGMKELGGIFLIRADIFKSVSGFKEYMKLDEDAELQIRLAEKGFFLCRLTHKIATHHTIFYFSLKRSLRRLICGDLLYLGAFYRDNLFNKFCLKKFFGMQKFTLSLLLFSFLSVLIHPAFLLFYPAVIIYKYYSSHSSKCSVFEYFLGRIAIDISLVIGFILFYPRLKKVNYTVRFE